jgi:hypothetical protein
MRRLWIALLPNPGKHWQEMKGKERRQWAFISVASSSQFSIYPRP